ncbi:hypothetical protein, partial [Streptomyces sp. NRRL S-495]|uniref:hypothetical protein n=1 Tax=Streptomyces sp. NRRL S-495 TaxID=1609133 RepID=UPI002570410A
MATRTAVSCWPGRVPASGLGCDVGPDTGRPRTEQRGASMRWGIAATVAAAAVGTGAAVLV